MQQVTSHVPSTHKGLKLSQGPHSALTCFLVQFTSGRTDTFHVPQLTAQQLQMNQMYKELQLQQLQLDDIAIGDYIVVEADRGEDLGRVIMNNIHVPMPRRNSTP